MFYDNHNHSQFSFDGIRTTVEKTAESAISKGLSGVCFTDHCDFFVPAIKMFSGEKVYEQFDIPAQQAEIDRVNGVLNGIRLFKGIEIGLQKSCRDQIRDLFSKNSFDEVVASLHYIDGQDPWMKDYYIGKDFRYAYGHYLQTLYEEMVWLGDFDIMGHFDYVARYAPYPQESILYKDFKDILESILKYLADNGKALEINTKTYQDYDGRTPVLDLEILRRYKELGGEIISLGSDSHDCDRVGHNFQYYADLVKSAGFKYLAHFEHRKLIQSAI